MTPSPDSTPGADPARGRAALVLALGAIFLARAVPGAVVESLRAELWLTDQALGTLASAFAGAYTVGLPAGAWVSRGGRRLRLLAAGLALSGLATAVSARAGGFFWLAVARAAAGFGAGLGAGGAADLLLRGARDPSGALGGDLACPEPRRHRAWAGLMPAATGIALGWLGGGLFGRAVGVPWLGRIAGWRVAFVGAGLALLASAAACLLARDPATASDRPGPWEALRRSGLREAVGRLAGDRARALALAAALVGAAGISALGFWLPAFLVRIRSVPSGDAGAQLAAFVLAAAILGGALARSALRARPAASGPRFVAAAGAAAGAAGVAIALAARTPILVLPALLLALVGASAGAYAAVTAVVGRDGVDAAALAISVLLVHGVGEVAGPIAVGAFADRAALWRALVLVPLLLLASAVLWAAAARAEARAAARSAAEQAGRHVA